MYKLSQNTFSEVVILRFNEDGSTTSMLTDSTNTDYKRFKLDLTNGAELQDADGNVMTAEQVQAFLETLP